MAVLRLACPVQHTAAYNGRHSWYVDASPGKSACLADLCACQLHVHARCSGLWQQGV
jgi:hypothetical protein